MEFEYALHEMLMEVQARSCRQICMTGLFEYSVELDGRSARERLCPPRVVITCMKGFWSDASDIYRPEYYGMAYRDRVGWCSSSSFDYSWE